MKLSSAFRCGVGLYCMSAFKSNWVAKVNVKKKFKTTFASFFLLILFDLVVQYSLIFFLKDSIHKKLLLSFLLLLLRFCFDTWSRKSNNDWSCVKKKRRAMSM